MQPRPLDADENYKAAGKVHGKVAIVTGGDSGIGRAAVVLLAKEGADVVVVYLKEHEDAEETQQMIEKTGRKCLLMAGDVGDEQFCRQVASERLEELVLLVTNSVFDDRHYTIEAPEGGSLPTLTFTNVACGEWQGTITTTRRTANEAFEHWETTETNVTFVPAPERSNPAQAGTMTWKVQDGSTTHWSGYESYNGCQTAKQVDVPLPVDLAGLSVVVATSDLDLLGRYISTGVVQHEQQMDFVCPWGSGGSQTWYLTSEWWPYPQSGEFGVVSPDGRVILGGLEQMDGNYTVTATWRLETVGP
jgi:hypothetical protein